MSGALNTENDVEKGQKNNSHSGGFKHTSDDDACFKLWNVYIDEAMRYDKALLEGWKKDMDGMLLFSALYSATLTALIVESYKTLQINPEDLTVALLTRISQQLSDGTVPAFEGPLPFQPTASSLLCNIFWFLSLALALTCSLLATFVQQWTRDFLYKTNMRPSPVLSARILAFSYFGLRRFGMHTFVDVIPILLHVSLFLFFAGLVAFLLPVNLPLMYIMACVLFVFTVVYGSLTIIPLIYLDAPYRTPASDILWYLGNLLHLFNLRIHKLGSNFTLTQAISEKSREDPAQRDRLCMEYTMKSLTYDTELLPMFAAIPEAILGPAYGSVRQANWTLISSLIQSPVPEHNLVSRLFNFIASPAATTWEEQSHRMSIAFEALWILAYYLITQKSNEIPQPDLGSFRVFWFDRNSVNALAELNSAPQSLLSSALALVRTSRLQSFRHCIDMVAEVLASDVSGVSESGKREKFCTSKIIFAGVSSEDIHWESKAFMESFINLREALEEGCQTSTPPARVSELWECVKEYVTELQDPVRWKAAQISILGGFLCKARDANVMPYALKLTYDTICSAIPPLLLFDGSVEVKEDEAVSSYSALDANKYASFTDTNLEPGMVTHEIFLLAMQVFFSTTYALSSHPEPAKCRITVEQYLCNRWVTCRDAFLRDKAGNLPACLIRDLHDGTERSALCICAIQADIHVLVEGPENWPRLLTLTKQLFELLPQASPQFTQHRVYPYLIIVTKWILCRDVLQCFTDKADIGEDSQAMKIVHTLGQEFLPHFSIPDCPLDQIGQKYSNWVSEIYMLLRSIYLILFAEYVTICMRTDLRPGMPHGEWIQDQFYYYKGKVDSQSQVQFAEAISLAVSSYLHSGQSSSSNAVKWFFEEEIWKISQDWSWITDFKCAKIVIDAIECHRCHASYTGMIYYEQSLFDRCKAVVKDAEESGDKGKGEEESLD